ncbi:MULTISPECIES: Lrp/AsnC family transcriptional regulator [Rhodococcus]|uniref:Lrp/AsnC family transcriptional regulator n=1 Tax=Rhodococcus TaxID=1827 RepID=UPI0011F6518E|nr:MULTISPECIES: Lrp/AsnC family transcriptional regulator [Rhodococcus]QXW01292.1 Lrp/AsnC family transcriptional regulator [Rhodococcus globerulus]RZL24620.1 MAG: Lrp/AsnC family transcriptional regulator [Rhodococcus sp. (in: high G+C Gram-positive bacteria)]
MPISRAGSNPRNPDPGSRLDELDERILWELVLDARISNRALADKVGVAPSTTLTRVQRLIDEGILQSSHAQINTAAVGLPLQAIISVRLHTQSRQNIDDFAATVVGLAAVVNVFHLGSADDFLVHVVCTSSEQLRDLVAAKVSRHPAVARTQTFIVFGHWFGSQYAGHISGFDEIRKAID